METDIDKWLNRGNGDAEQFKDKIQTELSKHLQEQCISGLSQGAKAIAQVVLNKCKEGNRKKQNPALTLAQVQKFCVTALNNQEVAPKEVE